MLSEIPLVGSLPCITVSVWRLYHAQIKKDREEHKKWEKEMHRNYEQAQEAALQMQQMQRAQQIAAQEETQYEQQLVSGEALY